MSSPEAQEQVPDFVKIFREKLDSVEPMTDKDSKAVGSFYEDAGIIEVRKEVPAILFTLNDEERPDPTDIWIENPVNIDRMSYYIHRQLQEKLNEFMGRGHYHESATEGYILEDSHGELYLILDKRRAESIKTHKESKDEFEKISHMNLLDLLNKYGISKVLENSPKAKTIKKDDPSEEIIDKNILEQRRESLALADLAQKHKMTNNQYMRLKILADTLHKAGQQVSIDEIAKSIVNDEEGVGIDVKHLPFPEEEQA